MSDTTNPPPFETFGEWHMRTYGAPPSDSLADDPAYLARVQAARDNIAPQEARDAARAKAEAKPTPKPTPKPTRSEEIAERLAQHRAAIESRRDEQAFHDRRDGLTRAEPRPGELSAYELDQLSREQLEIDAAASESDAKEVVGDIFGRATTAGERAALLGAYLSGEDESDALAPDRLRSIERARQAAGLA